MEEVGLPKPRAGNGQATPQLPTMKTLRGTRCHRELARDAFPEKSVVVLPSAMVATGLIPLNLFNSRRIDAADVTQQNGAARMIELVIVSASARVPGCRPVSSIAGVARMRSRHLENLDKEDAQTLAFSCAI